MASNRVSTEGCKVKWKQRARSKKRHASESDDDPIDNLLKQMDAAIPRTSQDVYRDRPNDDGIVHRVTKNQRKRNKKTAGTTSKQRVHQGENRQTENQPILYDPVSNEDAHADLCQYMSELISNGEFEVSEWGARKQAKEKNWESTRSSIFNCVLESYDCSGNDIQCHRCDKAIATIRCPDCLGSLLCPDCDTMMHKSQPFHDRQTWKNGIYENLPQEYYFPTTQHYTIRPCSCASKNIDFVDDGHYIAVTLKGRFDVPKYKTVCKGCRKERPEFDLVNLLHRGYWPGDPELISSYIYEQRLLDLWHSVSMNLPGSSLSGFLHSLGQISQKYGRKTNIDHTLFSRATSEYGYMQDSLLILKRQDNMKCPPCSIKQTMCHVDGNHKVYRFSHVDSGTANPYHIGRFIEPDEHVTAHLQKVYSAIPSTGSSANFYCGSTRWKAAKDVAKRKANLDETGLVVAGCRHAIAQKAVNMKHGELYGYAHYLHVNFMLPNSVQFIWQDVICKYWPWAKKVASALPVWKGTVTNMKPALSVMHSKAHSWHCQINWSGRYVEGAGAGSGEDMEQFFSHLSRTGNTTKHMGRAARIDTLTSHVLFWNGRKIRLLPELLCKRYKKLKQNIVENDKDLTVLTGKVDEREDLLEKWKDDITGTAKGASSRSSSKKINTNEYFITQKIREADALRSYLDGSSHGLSTVLGSSQLFTLVSGIYSEAEQYRKLTHKTSQLQTERETLITSTLQSIRLEIEVSTHAYHQRKHDMDKLAGTSKQRMKMRNKSANDKNRLSQLLTKLYVVELMRDCQAKKLDINDIVNGLFPWQQTASTTWATKKKAVDAYMFRQRLCEEEELLVGEMKNILIFYTRQLQILKIDIADLDKEYEVSVNEGGGMNSADVPEDTIPSLRYTVSEIEKTPCSVKGMRNIKYIGVQEAKARINHALTCFKRVLADGGWDSMVLDFLDDHEDSAEDDDFEDGDEEENIEF